MKDQKFEMLPYQHIFCYPSNGRLFYAVSIDWHDGQNRSLAHGENLVECMDAARIKFDELTAFEQSKKARRDEMASLLHWQGEKDDEKMMIEVWHSLIERGSIKFESQADEVSLFEAAGTNAKWRVAHFAALIDYWIHNKANGLSEIWWNEKGIQFSESILEKCNRRRINPIEPDGK